MKRFFISILGFLNICAIGIISALVCAASALFLPKNRF